MTMRRSRMMSLALGSVMLLAFAGGVASGQGTAKSGDDKGSKGAKDTRVLKTVEDVSGVSVSIVTYTEPDGATCVDTVLSLSSGKALGGPGRCGKPSAATAGALMGAASPATPELFASGGSTFVPSTGKTYTTLGGVVSCRCTVMASWSDGTSASADATSGNTFVLTHVDDGRPPAHARTTPPRVDLVAGDGAVLRSDVRW